MADRMTDDELLALIGNYEKSALGSSVAVGPSVAGTTQPSGQSMTTLEIDRFNALNAYFARPLGNEIENRSQIVFPELRDTVEWIMPQLMRMFAAGKVCQFDGDNPEDEKQAEIETEVVNHLFMKDNDGFFILHDMFKDALLLRNGYVNVYWDEEEKTTFENYTGLNEIELAELLQPQDDQEIEIVEQNEEVTEIPLSLLPPGSPPVSISAFDLKIKRKQKVGRVKVECAPPEEILVSPAARHGLEDSPFTEHKTQVSRSRLIEMGFSPSVVARITVAKPDWLNLISIARDEVTDQLGDDDPTDQASQMVDLRTVYVRCDYDGDGISELRRVIIGGNKILDNDECEEISLVGCVPMRMPHRHVGISYYDLLMDLQVIKTTLFRQGLDNLYVSNNQRMAVNWRQVNVQDLLVSRPGGVVRVDGPVGDNLVPLATPSNLMQQIIPALEYCDLQREMRTGIGKDTMGLDADALQDVTKGGQLASMSAAAMKVELVARLLAEGVKDVFGKIHRLLIRHQDQAMTMKIAGQWVDVDPSTWKDRTRVSVNVGLGSGNREEAQKKLMLLGQAQAQLAQFGMVGPKQAWATFQEVTHLLGFENPGKFAMDPDSQEYQQAMQQHAQQAAQQPNPEIMKIQQQGQIAAQQAQQRAQEVQQDLQMKMQAQAADAAAKDKQIQMEAQRDEMQRQQEAALEQQRQQFDAAMKAREADIMQWKAKLDAETKILVAQISASQGQDTATPEGDTNSAIAEALSGLKDAISGMSKPKTATLSDGRQIRIE